MIVAQIPDSCLWCWNKFGWHDPIIVKYPECACFWLCCWNKYEDPKNYDLENEWWIVAEFEPWLTLENDL